MGVPERKTPPLTYQVPMRVRVLQPVPSVRFEGETVDVTGYAARMLTALVVRKGAPVSKPRLKRLVWGTVDISDSTLQRVSRDLRSAMDGVHLGEALESVRGVGYRLTVPTVVADLAALEASVTLAEESLGRNDVAAAVVEAQEAERHWRAYPPIDLPAARALIRSAFAIQLRAGILREGVADERSWRRAHDILTAEDRERVAAEVLFACLSRAEELIGVGSVVSAFSARTMLMSLLNAFPTSAEARSLLNHADWLIYHKSLKCPRLLKDVEADARDVLDVRPDCLSARLTMTRILFEHGSGEEELREAYEAMTARPQGIRARRVVARALIDTGQSESALELLDTTDLERLDYRSLELLTYAYLHLGEYELAIEAGEHYAAVRREIDGNIGWGMALALINHGQHRKAKMVLLNAIELEPSNVSLWVQLVNAFACADGKIRARQMALHAIDRLGTLFDAERSSNLRAVAWYTELVAMAGMGEQVAKLASRLRVEAPRNGYLAYRVGLAYGRLNRVHPAMVLLSDAARLGFCAVEQLHQEVKCISSLRDAVALRRVVAQMNHNVSRLRSMFTFDVGGEGELRLRRNCTVVMKVVQDKLRSNPANGYSTSSVSLDEVVALTELTPFDARRALHRLSRPEVGLLRRHGGPNSLDEARWALLDPVKGRSLSAFALGR